MWWFFLYSLLQVQKDVDTQTSSFGKYPSSISSELWNSLLRNSKTSHKFKLLLRTKPETIFAFYKKRVKKKHTLSSRTALTFYTYSTSSKQFKNHLMIPNFLEVFYFFMLIRIITEPSTAKFPLVFFFPLSLFCFFITSKIFLHHQFFLRTKPRHFLRKTF